MTQATHKLTAAQYAVMAFEVDGKDMRTHNITEATMQSLLRRGYVVKDGCRKYHASDEGIAAYLHARDAMQSPA